MKWNRNEKERETKIWKGWRRSCFTSVVRGIVLLITVDRHNRQIQSEETVELYDYSSAASYKHMYTVRWILSKPAKVFWELINSARMVLPLTV